jgi:hypothetical protein
MATPLKVRYKASRDKVIAAATAAISGLGYVLGAIDNQNGLISFETGMSMSSWAGQKMSVHVMDVGLEYVDVTIGGAMKTHGAQIQLYDWNEAAQIGTKVFKQMDSTLGEGVLLNGEYATGPCFIATASYGDEHHPTVERYRQFRDKRLMPNSIGRCVVQAYYKVGPHCARFVTQFPLLRKYSRMFLDFLIDIIS